MSSGGSSVVNILFPIPFFCLLLMALPFPAIISIPARKTINYFLDKIIFPHVFGGMSLYQIITLFSIFLFAEALWQTMAANEKVMLAIGNNGGHLESQMRCLKWKCERNFWISLFSLTSWLVLYHCHRITKELDNLKRRIRVGGGGVQSGNGSKLIVEKEKYGVVAEKEKPGVVTEKFHDVYTH
jgi:hypothetical protein